LEARVFRFKPKYISGFVPQEMQKEEWDSFQNLREDPIVDEYLIEGMLTQVLQIDGETKSIFGYMPIYEGGANGWLFFSNTSSARELLYITAYLKNQFAELKTLFDWLRTPVRTDFPQGERWAKLLGFQKADCEETMINGLMYTYWTRRL
tara:strand:+ start:150 stop:599 length:450 start_codon:yes stop_codon:yes gene_type:complete